MRLFILATLVLGSLACQHKGKTFKHGEEWREQNAFLMSCRIEANGSWRVEVKACITPDGMQVPVNSTVPSGQFEWECRSSATGQISLKQAIGKRADCAGGHSYGSTWTDKSFQFRCDEGGQTRFTGCLTSTGHFIPEGQDKEIGGMNVECRRHANGTITMGAVAGPNAQCKDSDGIMRQSGEKWTESEHFVKTCRGGMPVVIGCEVEGLTAPVPLNGKVSKGNTDYFCEGSEGAYKFYSKIRA